MQKLQRYSEIIGKSDGLTVAELLLRYLEIEGVSDIFGVPGTPLAYLLKALKDNRAKFTYHICRQETGAGYMADAYARVTGKLGVSIVSAGPSATNALTGSAVAQSCGSAVLTISGEVARSAFGRGGFQEGIDSTLDIHAVFSNADIFSTVITDPSNFQTLFEQALRTCLSLPRQAAHVSLPVDVGGATFGTDVHIPKSPSNYRAVPRGRDPDAAEKIMSTLATAKRPLLYLGNGCRSALIGPRRMTGEARAEVEHRRARFQNLTTRFALAVTTTPNAKGVFPETHPLSLRNYGFGGSNWSVNYLTADARSAAGSALPYDALLVLGSSLTEKSTNSWDPVLIPDGPILQVDLNQGVIGRGFPIAAGVVAEIGGFIDDLIECADRIKKVDPAVKQRAEFIKRLKQAPPAPPSNSSEAELVRAMNELLPPGSQLFIDASICAVAALRYMAIDPPSEMHNAFNMEPMGWAPAAVVGAALGAPDDICVSLSGDGGFMMNGNEVSTAAQYGIGAVWVVHYNDTLAAVEVNLQQEFPGDGWMDLYKLGAPNLVDFARGLGADAVEVAGSGFKSAFAAALAGSRQGRKPQVVVVKG
jgi:acetolactate synthase-1/2/3 large subunit